MARRNRVCFPVGPLDEKRLALMAAVRGTTVSAVAAELVLDGLEAEAQTLEAQIAERAKDEGVTAEDWIFQALQSRKEVSKKKQRQ